MSGFVANIGKLNHKLFTSICESNFVQSVALHKTTDMLFSFDNPFESDQKAKKQTVVSNPISKTVSTTSSVRSEHDVPICVDKNLLKAFKSKARTTDKWDSMLIKALMRYIAPLTMFESNNGKDSGTTTTREFSFELKKNLDMYPNLIKSVSNHHRSMRKKIEQYVDMSHTSNDTTHMDKDYMLFWSCLLHKKICVVSNNLYYTEYVPLTGTDNGNLVIHAKTSSNKTWFALEEIRDLDNYKLRSNLKSWVDPKKLRSKKLDELHSICREHDVDTMDGNNKKIKKETLIAELEKKLIPI